MNKSTQLKILHGAIIKLGRLRTLVSTHYNAEGWDTNVHSAEAGKLLDDLADMMQTLREAELQARE